MEIFRYYCIVLYCIVLYIQHEEHKVVKDFALKIGIFFLRFGIVVKFSSK